MGQIYANMVEHKTAVASFLHVETIQDADGLQQLVSPISLGLAAVRHEIGGVWQAFASRDEAENDYEGL